MPTSEAEIDTLVDELIADFPPKTTDPVVFLGEQFDRGIAWAHFPVGHGGLGASPAGHLVVLRRLSKVGASPR
jgi:alkylation response protein AidB-like acyl-CoA dehydrogenase